MMGLLTKINQPTYLQYANLIIVLVVVSLVLLIASLILRGEIIRKIFLISGCVCVVVSGCFSCASLYKYASTKSTVIGSVTSQESSQDIVWSYDYSDLVFYKRDTNDTSDTAIYYYVDEVAKADFNGLNKSYMLTVNGDPCSNFYCGKSRVYGVLNKQFIKDNKTLTVSISINIQFAANKTIITFETVGDSTNINYFLKYVSNNNLSLKIVEV